MTLKTNNIVCHDLKIVDLIPQAPGTNILGYNPVNGQVFATIGGGGGAGNLQQTCDLGNVTDTGLILTSNVSIASASTTDSISIGYRDSPVNQGNSTISLGNNAGNVSQGVQAIAIGLSAGNDTQHDYAIAIGSSAGSLNQNKFGIAIGIGAGQNNQLDSAIAIGNTAGNNGQGDSSIAIGNTAGSSAQGVNSIAIGSSSGSGTQGANSIAIGSGAGNSSQKDTCIAIGPSAGEINQHEGAIALGNQAGNNEQNELSIAIGYQAGNSNQQVNCIAIGSASGLNSQGKGSVAIGSSALSSANGAGLYSVAIGTKALDDPNGYNSCIVLNSTGNLFPNPADITQDGCFFVSYIRGDDNSHVNNRQLNYDTATGEIYTGTTSSLRFLEDNSYNLDSTNIVQYQFNKTVDFENERQSFINYSLNTHFQVRNLVEDGVNSYIPFFSSDIGDQQPGNVINALPAIYPESPYPDGNNTVIVPNPAYGTYLVGTDHGTLYEFEISTNTWKQVAEFAGPIFCIYVDNNDIWVGGSFKSYVTITITSPTDAWCIAKMSNGGYISQPLLDPNTGATGVDNEVYTITKWNGFITFGGKFSQTNTNSSYLDFVAYWDPIQQQWLSIDGVIHTNPHEAGVNDIVRCLTVMPANNGLVMGGVFTEQYYTGTTTNYMYLTILINKIGFYQVADGVDGYVWCLFLDEVGCRLYIGGLFHSLADSTIQNFTYISSTQYEDKFGKTYIPDLNIVNSITKDPVSNYIIVQTQDKDVYAFNPFSAPDNPTWDYWTIIYGFSIVSRYVNYDRIANAVIVITDKAVYRVYCSQTAKLVAINGIHFYDPSGHMYDTICFPTLNDFVKLCGSYSVDKYKWFIESASPNVYYEWSKQKKTEVKKIKGSFISVTTQDIIPGDVNKLLFYESTGDLYLIPKIGNLIVPQKGTYKISYRLELLRTLNGTKPVYAYIGVNDKIIYETANRITLNLQIDLSNLSGSDGYTVVNGEYILNINENDFLSIYVYTNDNGISISKDEASHQGSYSQIPTTPSAIVNIEMIQPLGQLTTLF